MNRYYGNLSGDTHKAFIPFAAAAGKGLTLRGFLVFEVIHDGPRLALAASFIERGLHMGELKPVTARTFTLDHIVEAHRYLESHQQLGRIVVTLP